MDESFQRISENTYRVSGVLVSPTMNRYITGSESTMDEFESTLVPLRPWDKWVSHGEKLQDWRARAFTAEAELAEIIFHINALPRVPFWSDRNGVQGNVRFVCADDLERIIKK